MRELNFDPDWNLVVPVCLLILAGMAVAHFWS